MKTLNRVDEKSEQRGPRSKKQVILCIARCLEYLYILIPCDLLKSLTFVSVEVQYLKPKGILVVC